MDREKPFQYRFVIFTEARGGSTFFTDLLTYTIKCPSSLNFATNSFNTNMKSFKGATGLDALFSFSKTVPDLPMCTEILDYSFVDISYTDLDLNA